MYNQNLRLKPNSNEVYSYTTKVSNITKIQMNNAYLKIYCHHILWYYIKFEKI